MKQTAMNPSGPNRNGRRKPSPARSFMPPTTSPRITEATQTRISTGTSSDSVLRLPEGQQRDELEPAAPQIVIVDSKESRDRPVAAHEDDAAGRRRNTETESICRELHGVLVPGPAALA